MFNFFLLPHHLEKVIKQKTTDTLEKLTETETNKEKIILVKTYAQWGGHNMYTHVYICVCANTYAVSLNGQLQPYAVCYSSSVYTCRLFM